jgi:hypothetical protein
MVLCALVTGRLAGVSAKPLLALYVSTSLAITFVSVMLTMFWWVLQLMHARSDAPLRAVKDKLTERAPYLLLPGMIFPLFLACFTATKTAIPFLVGYTWDHFWAEADRLIFGNDAWRITHWMLGNAIARTLEIMYVVGWGLGFLFVMALVPLNTSARFTAKFYTAMMATWLFGGMALAYLFSAAGPVFAHLVGGHGPDEFAGLRAVLDSTLAPYSPIRHTQEYLSSAVYSHVPVQGGGISAMPSMHLGVASIYVLGARGTRLLIPSIFFWLMIFICSAYFGYHYWVDGIVAAAVAAACWKVAERVFTPSTSTTRFLPDVPTAVPSI